MPPGEDAVLRATSLLDAGELVILPMDQGYALAADALQDEPVARLFRALDRPADQALATLVGGFEDLHHVAHATSLARTLALAWWPGPLALRLRAKAWLPDALTAHGELVDVHAPALAFPRSLAAHFGPLAFAPLLHEGAPVDEAGAAQLRVGAAAGLAIDAGRLVTSAATLVDATGAEGRVLSEGAIASAEVLAHGRRSD